MTKVIKLNSGVPVKNVPAWKNRAVIDEVKDDIVQKHNEKLKGQKGSE